ncbi:hypothetical protein AKJ35_01170 [candidate division MSBL1 archaeon SCGC-AAA833F18]|uniref:Transcription factor CBF/NF-Y/archaeal histone domain-containing protein n=1 Tax=candidate division MSBL1 archaeon SCGC-AAA833F18 TaxID=1698257 RepID=A0A133VS39_9EURY|nr:hypothetical protein AKJ35_01170 [candidate division MSBL1 archaeon SCGC-AAA833F18]
MPEFPLSTMKRLLRRAGNEGVSRSAAIELSAVLESVGEDIAEQAVRSADNRGVKTVSEEDVRAAVKTLNRPRIRW